MGKRILIIEDDSVTLAEAVLVVRDAGFEVVTATTLTEARAVLALSPVDLAVVDRMLPDGDGLDLVRELAARRPRPATLVLSALGRAMNRVEGLDSGADDYLAKPYEPEELAARIRALLRRPKAADPDMAAFGDLDVHFKARTVHRRGQHVPLSRKEFELLKVFLDHEGEVLTRMMLLERVWNLKFDPQTNVVDVHVGRLRRKLALPGTADLIHTSRGEGYAFQAVAPEDDLS